MSRQSKRDYSLGVTLDPCLDGLKIITMEANGALGRTGRVFEKDVIVAINDVPVIGKKASELADLIHNQRGWYSGISGVSTITFISDDKGHQADARDKLITVVVRHTDSDTKERDHALFTVAGRPLHTAAHRPTLGGVDQVAQPPSPLDTVCSDCVGIGLTVSSEPSGLVRVVDISPWGTARWTGNMLKRDIIDYVDGTACKGLSARSVVDLLNGSPGAAPSLELVYTRQHSVTADVQMHIELSRVQSPSVTTANVIPRDQDSLDVELLTALHYLRDMTCSRKELPDSIYHTNTKHLVASHARALLLHQVQGLWESVSTNTQERGSDSTQQPGHAQQKSAQKSGQHTESRSSWESHSTPRAARVWDSPYSLVTAYGHARAAADAQLQEVLRLEGVVEAARSSAAAEIWSLEQQLKGKAFEVQTAHSSQLQQLREPQEHLRSELQRQHDTLRQMQAELEEAEEELTRLEAKALTSKQLHLAALNEEALIRGQEEVAARENKNMTLQRATESANFAAFVDAEKRAAEETWPRDLQAQEKEREGIEKGIAHLTTQEQALANATQKSEVRRRELLALLERASKLPWVPAAIPPDMPSATASRPLMCLPAAIPPYMPPNARIRSDAEEREAETDLMGHNHLTPHLNLRPHQPEGPLLPSQHPEGPSSTRLSLQQQRSSDPQSAQRETPSSNIKRRTLSPKPPPKISLLKRSPSPPFPPPCPPLSERETSPPPPLVTAAEIEELVGGHRSRSEPNTMGTLQQRGYSRVDEVVMEADTVAVEATVMAAHTVAQPSEMAAGYVASELHSGDVQDKRSPLPDTRQQQDNSEHEPRGRAAAEVRALATSEKSEREGERLEAAYHEAVAQALERRAAETRSAAEAAAAALDIVDSIEAAAPRGVERSLATQVERLRATQGLTSTPQSTRDSQHLSRDIASGDSGQAHDTPGQASESQELIGGHRLRGPPAAETRTAAAEALLQPSIYVGAP